MRILWQALFFGAQTGIRNAGFSRVAAAILLLGSGAISALPNVSAQRNQAPRNVRPKLEYTLRYDRVAAPEKLFVSLTATGLPTAAPNLVGRLADWGGWTSAPTPHVANLRIEGRPHTFAPDGTVPIPAASLADGKLTLSYEILIYALESPEHQQRTLLPYRTAHNLCAFTKNTLLGLRRSNTPLDAAVTVKLTGRADDTVFTGWAGRSQGTQTGSLNYSLIYDNGIFAIGRPFGFLAKTSEGASVEVMQLADAPDITQAVAEVAAKLLPVYARSTGRQSPSVVRIFMTQPFGKDATGGTCTEAGVDMKAAVTGSLEDVNKETLAHELFHLWLGRGLSEDGSATWFSEGFTDYLSLWHGVTAGVVTPQRFAARMLDSAQQVQALERRPAFADVGVKWRDNDGPNETMAYKGGALLALLLDVRLRQRSQKTVTEVLRALAQTQTKASEYGLPQLRAIITSLGLQDIYEQSIAGTRLPDARALLIEAGYDEGEVREPAALTYLGIEAQTSDTIPAVITAIDPKGPAAKVDLLPGDTIVSCGERRKNPPLLGEKAPTKYRFGLTIIPSGLKSARLEVLRNGERLQREVALVLISGGFRSGLQWNPARGKSFFGG